MNKIPKIGIPLLIFVTFSMLILAKSFVTIGPGEAGVLYRVFAGGVVTDQPAMGEGFHLVLPWNKVYIYEVRQQEVFEKMNVLSSNGLDIKLEVSAWFQPDYANLGRLHQEKSEAFKQRILFPAIRSAARSVVGRYTPQELYSTKRDAIQIEIYEETKKIVSDQYIQLNEVLVRDVTLPASMNEAIERKLKQEQSSEEYDFKLEVAEKEAEKQRIEARGKADANRILAASLTSNILKDKGIEATLKLALSPNAKVVVIGGGEDGLPLILGNN